MTIGSVLLVGLLAMAPNWAIVDIPYPESSGGLEARGATPEAQVIDALAHYARGKALTLRKADIVELRIEGPRATARLALPSHAETVHLELVQHEWRVVRIE